MSSIPVSVVNLGCRVNRVESDRIIADLAAAGFDLVDQADADLIVINTCAVTGEAEAKTRKAVRHALSRPREPRVIVTGCVVNLHADSLTALSDRVFAEPSKVDVAHRAIELTGAPVPDMAGCRDDDVSDLLGRSRIGVKVQDGCNNRCSYCIVWKARGPEVSVPLDSVVSSVRDACAAGVPEIVLTGINLGAYDALDADGSRIGIDGLLSALVERTEIPQIRLSSLEPMDVEERLIRAMVDGGARVAPFLHLPLQSGCTSTLERMNRPYTAQAYGRLVSMIRQSMPAASISCDVIVGFPGETDEEFEESLAFCESMRFSRMHVFRYSARPGTPAASAPGQVDPHVAAVRSARLRAVAEEGARRDAASRIGTRERAVLEYGNRGTLGSFHRVIVRGELPEGSGRLVDVDIVDMDERGVLIGEAVGLGCGKVGDR